MKMRILLMIVVILAVVGFVIGLRVGVRRAENGARQAQRRANNQTSEANTAIREFKERLKELVLQQQSAQVIRERLVTQFPEAVAKNQRGSSSPKREPRSSPGHPSPLLPVPAPAATPVPEPNAIKQTLCDTFSHDFLSQTGVNCGDGQTIMCDLFGLCATPTPTTKGA